MSELENLLSKGYPLILFTKLVLGAIAVFFGILAWTKTKATSIVFFILGVFAIYISILYNTLLYFGFIDNNILNVGDIYILPIVFEGCPILLFIIAFCIFLREKSF